MLPFIKRRTLFPFTKVSILSLVFSFSGGESEPAYSAKFDFETMELVAILFSEYPSVI